MELCDQISIYFLILSDSLNNEGKIFLICFSDFKLIIDCILSSLVISVDLVFSLTDFHIEISLRPNFFLHSLFRILFYALQGHKLMLNYAFFMLEKP